MSMKTKRLVLAGITALSVTAIGCVSTFVYAQPSSSELEQKTSSLNNELSSLNGELASLLNEMDALSSESEELASKMEETQARLDEAQAKGEQQYEDMKLRIKYMYEAGDTSFIELICSSKSMSDFLNKTDFVKNVSEYDRSMLDELLATQNEICEENEQLEKQHQELVGKQEELRAKRTQVESLISSTSSQLADYQAQLERAKQAEALATQQALERQQQSQTPNTPAQPSRPVPPEEHTPASPEGKKSLGSFRITHYCPCYACCGSWGGGTTSSGTVPTPGRTIAVDPSVIPLGTRVIINGQVYVAEDTGGAIKGKKIDIFVGSHGGALAAGTYYTEVYLAD